MKENKYSDEITKLATISQAKERYKMSRYCLMKYASEYGALVRLGDRIVRIDVTKFDRAIEGSR